MISVKKGDRQTNVSIFRIVSAMRPASLNAGITMETVGVAASTGATRPAPIEVSDASINRRIVSSGGLYERQVTSSVQGTKRRSHAGLDDASGRPLPAGISRDSTEVVLLGLWKKTGFCVGGCLASLWILGVEVVSFFSSLLISGLSVGVSVFFMV